MAHIERVLKMAYVKLPVYMDAYYNTPFAVLYCDTYFKHLDTYFSSLLRVHFLCANDIFLLFLAACYLAHLLPYLPQRGVLVALAGSVTGVSHFSTFQYCDLHTS